jgi:DNA-binding MarR family transcriptional regulator
MAEVCDLSSADRLRHSPGVFVRVVLATARLLDENEIATLAYIERDGPMSIAELGRRRGIRHQSMSATVVDLEASGLIVRSRDSDAAR